MPRILLALPVALLLLANVPLPQAPVQYVTDAAGAIPDAREISLNETLAQHERDTGNQLIVYVDRRVPAGTTLEEMGAEAIRTWRIGQEKKDNGAILFFFIEDRQSRIEVGYGLEGVLTDALSKRILVDLRPSLQVADYASAAELGTSAIIAALAPPKPYDPAQEQADRAAAIQLRADEIAEREKELIIPATIFGIVFFTLIFYMLYRVFIVGDWKLGRDGGSRSGSSSSSSSSSGFSGGGGSGGGGGASDRW